MWLYKMWYEDNMYLDMCPYVLIHEKWKIVFTWGKRVPYVIWYVYLNLIICNFVVIQVHVVVFFFDNLCACNDFGY